MISGLCLFCREVDSKENEIWNENGTVTFYRKKIWIFEESLSSGNLTDEITNLNPIVAVRCNYLATSRIIFYMLRCQILDGCILGEK